MGSSKPPPASADGSEGRGASPAHEPATAEESSESASSGWMLKLVLVLVMVMAPSGIPDLHVPPKVALYYLVLVLLPCLLYLSSKDAHQVDTLVYKSKLREMENRFNLQAKAIEDGGLPSVLECRLAARTNHTKNTFQYRSRQNSGHSIYDSDYSTQKEGSDVSTSAVSKVSSDVSKVGSLKGFDPFSLRKDNSNAAQQMRHTLQGHLPVLPDKQVRRRTIDIAEHTLHSMATAITKEERRSTRELPLHKREKILQQRNGAKKWATSSQKSLSSRGAGSFTGSDGGTESVGTKSSSFTSQDSLVQENLEKIRAHPVVKKMTSELGRRTLEGGEDGVQDSPLLASLQMEVNRLTVKEQKDSSSADRKVSRSTIDVGSHFRRRSTFDRSMLANVKEVVTQSRSNSSGSDSEEEEDQDPTQNIPLWARERGIVRGQRIEDLVKS